MPLPDLIEIVPLTAPVHAEITVPGSKSITNRALILAALADGETTLQGALWSEDTQVMVDCLQKLGFTVQVSPDPDESCNRTITVKGLGGKIPRGGTPERPLELFVGNAGTAARFLSALVCLGDGVYRLHGMPRMHERPQAALFKALRELGYRVEPEQGNDKLPAKIFGNGSTTSLRQNGPRACTVSIEESSQFASGLLLCAKIGGWQVKIVGENAEEAPYVVLTEKLIKAFANGWRTFRIEPDLSSGSYFYALAFLDFRTIAGESFRVDVAVRDRPKISFQIDDRFQGIISDLPIDLTGVEISRRTELGDSIMTAIVLAPFHRQSLRFVDLKRLRLQESDRVLALHDELRKCGAVIRMLDNGDTLEVSPSQLHGAEIETYHDHRMAMCFAILGLKVPGIKIRNPACVKKTFPNFFQKLATAPPKGLGATILDARTGRPLSHEDLFAE